MWIKSYLHSRKQKVFVNSVLSNDLPLNAGVPQGSVLGPLLFYYTLMLLQTNLVRKTRLYADDTSLSFSSSILAEIETIK